MGINLDKRNDLPAVAPAAAVAPAPATPTTQAANKQLSELIKNRFSVAYGSDYCDNDSWHNLLSEGTKLGLEPGVAKTILDVELEKAGIANERNLLDELGNLLGRTAGREKKLHEKDRQDSLHLVCTPRRGFTRGLDVNSAARFVVEFCRSNHISLKSGLFSWKIP